MATSIRYEPTTTGRRRSTARSISGARCARSTAANAPYATAAAVNGTSVLASDQPVSPAATRP
ncbi:hypothetical protein ACFQ7F_29355 [Streptomyces sp. NPDC056486]|uniref:hypothetical protein n=1 Tax=Streptomyces sp. NPDC056486 TaxID=3345835 RepID=UPI003694E1F0